MYETFFGYTGYNRLFKPKPIYEPNLIYAGTLLLTREIFMCMPRLLITGIFLYFSGYFNKLHKRELMRKETAISAFIVMLMILAGTAYGQQEPQFSQNMFTKLSINPAVAGIDNAICAKGLFRQQWVGFEDAEGENVAPQSFLIMVDAPIKFLHGGIGISIMDDQLGYEKNLGVKIDYAYHTTWGMGDFSIGIQGIFLNKSLDFSKFKPIQSEDPLLQSSGEEKTMLADVGIGAYYRVPGKYFIGFSSTQLMQNSGTLGIGEAENVYLKRHYYLMGGFQYTLPGNPKWELNPMVLIKTDGVSAQYDINALLKYNNKFWGGVTYRVQDAIALMVGMEYKDFKLGYSYDITTSKLSSAGSGGSHEIFFGYCFKLEFDKTPRRYLNTRYL